MSKKFDFLVFIGRFQPFHNGHKRVIDEALKQARRVIVLVGSANSPRTYRNPWTYDERADIISNHYNSDNDLELVIVTPILDYVYNNNAWVENIQNAVQGIIAIRGFDDSNIGLIGHSKDASSYYLNLFPQWDSVDVPQHTIYNATDIREKYFSSTPYLPEHIAPATTVEFLKKFLETVEYKNLYEENVYIRNYKKSFENLPYPPTFVTVDAVVVQAGHVLLVRRKSMPGKGLLALPGGFINELEYIEDAMIRELYEETRIKLTEPVLRGNIVKTKVFDDPNRSPRGRVITHASLIHLKPKKQLPAVKGRSDAIAAMWIPLSDLKPDELFEDHFFIIQNLTREL